MIVTIARKGYQFTENVTVVEAANTVKQAVVQVPTAESSLANTQSPIEGRADAAISKAPKLWRKAAILVASTLILVAVAYAPWRRFAGVTPPRSVRGAPQATPRAARSGFAASRGSRLTVYTTPRGCRGGGARSSLLAPAIRKAPVAGCLLRRRPRDGGM